MPNRLIRAFTIIELLVVVTIIVVLLALLTPALDKALASAELMMCQSQLHTVGAGGVGYAAANKRYHFYRAGAEDPDITDYQPRMINIPFNRNNPNALNGYDDRVLMRPYFDVNALQCPLAGDIDLDSAESQDGSTYIYTSYSLWFGWKYRMSTAGKGMKKLGDRMSFSYPGYGDQGWPDRMQFDVLAGDVSSVIWTGWNSAHPDKNGAIAQVEKQDEAAAADYSASRLDPDAKITTAEWYGALFEISPPGKIDSHYLYGDLSVKRITDADWDPRQYKQPWGKKDPRLWPVPATVDAAATEDDNYNLDLLSIAR